MKIKRPIYFISILLFSLFTFGNYVSGQEDYPLPVYMELTTWKNSDNTRDLITKLTTDGDEGEIPVEGLTVRFLEVGNDRETSLAEAVSDEKGKAIAHFAPDLFFPRDEEGYINITAFFDGDEKYDPAEAEISFKDATVDITFEEDDDGVKNILFKGTVILKEGDTIPLADDDLYFFVPRMFSDLKIADGWFEEDGTGSVEFPLDLIGDSTGAVKVIARILEHSDYGNVEKSSEVFWAIPRHLIAREGPVRELWTPIAPLWMIITLVIMLAGVWGHYFYAVYELYMIRKLSKKDEKDDYSKGR